jgi:uncharacterized LabA/DUF88 family protein
MEPAAPRVALLIDADNAPASKIGLVFEHLTHLGTVQVRRAYGNWRKDCLQGWAKVLHKHAIVPVQQFDYVTGKNATDIALAIDAMDLLQTMRPEIYGIVAGDSDYTPLAVRLITSGASVFGFGRVNTTSVAFQEACTKFVALDSGNANSAADDSSTADDQPESPSSSPASSSTPSDKPPEKVFWKAVQKNQQTTGWADVKSIGAYLTKHKIVKAAYSVNRWASYYKKFPVSFEVRELNGKTMIRVLKPK